MGHCLLSVTLFEVKLNTVGRPYLFLFQLYRLTFRFVIVHKKNIYHFYTLSFVVQKRYDQSMSVFYNQQVEEASLITRLCFKSQVLSDFHETF